MIDFPTDCIARKPFIREEAAIAAMKAIMATSNDTIQALAAHHKTTTMEETVAVAACSFADQLIKELYK